MKQSILMAVFATMASLTVMAQPRYVTRSGTASVFSHMPAEDIHATNTNVTGLINTETGDFAISVPVQSFQFEKALMQEHFNNSNFMDSRKFPRIAVTGKITNLNTISFSKDGKYDAVVSGEITIRNIAKPISEKALIEIANGKLTVSSRFLVRDIGSFGIGKPKGKMKNNVSDDIQVTFFATYDKDVQ